MFSAFHAVCRCVPVQVAEETEAQYVSVENEEHLTEAPLAVLEDNSKHDKSTISLLAEFVKLLLPHSLFLLFPAQIELLMSDSFSSALQNSQSALVR